MAEAICGKDSLYMVIIMSMQGIERTGTLLLFSVALLPVDRVDD